MNPFTIDRTPLINAAQFIFALLALSLFGAGAVIGAYLIF